MIILVVNCGSSSLKYSLFQDQRELGSGLFEKIGTGRSTYTRLVQGQKQQARELELANHTQAIKEMMSWLVQDQLIKAPEKITAIGHRVVHGGPKFKDATLVDQEVLNNKIGRALAPLHQASYVGIEACMQMLPQTPQVAVFDTAFHQTMPAHAYTYALPHELSEKYSIRKYGFHGSSHKYVALEAAKLLKKKPAQTNIITLHLGNGSSITAVRRGRCLDTSMGLTPLAGVVMGTRCGDIDPAIVPLIMEKEQLDVHQVDALLNKKSGVLGLSGISNDMREVLAKAKEGHQRAQLAIDVFVYSIQKYIGAYHAVLGGAQALVFTAGIGEKSAALRERICRGLKGLGVLLDAKKNKAAIGKKMAIHARGSKIKILVIPTNEELMIAQETVRIVGRRKSA